MKILQSIKQVILIRKDLRMRRGKEIAQGSHAAMEFILSRIRQSLHDADNKEVMLELSDIEKTWLTKGMAKVCLRVNSQQELLDYHHKAQACGLYSHLIIDSGRTEFAGVATPTACAIGPDEVNRINTVTGDLVPY